MMTIEWQDEQVQRALEESTRLADDIERACIRRLQNHWAQQIALDADVMVPVQFGASWTLAQVAGLPSIS